ncbi:uncharacterized protein DUF616 [Mangrovibacterium marinum]|uniref:Uncharacterized protein DUF616 n=1 Tax=Mangrovibacterium marinum TaxID=1639118 RepID=A0A2T5BTT6_9BACT|nr:glycosyltransferase domain-containing protein [Mangrovibacterium marinum]PTN02884.1 uncharacterized protein DUF616 [Mangrovibacterium marinum]
MKKVIYTCLTGNYDALQNPKYIMEGWDYICFTDTPDKHTSNNIWQYRQIPSKVKDNLRRSRYVKLKPHEVLQEYNISVYIDSNITILDNKLEERIDQLLKLNSKISIAKHPERNCIYKEGEVCIRERLDRKRTITKQLRYLNEQKFPKHFGLYENNIIFRQHNDPQIVTLGNEWWNLYLNYSKRDQLSLAYLLWQNGIECTPLFRGSFNVRESSSFQYTQHEKRAGTITKRLIEFIKKYFIK